MKCYEMHFYWCLDSYSADDDRYQTVFRLKQISNDNKIIASIGLESKHNNINHINVEWLLIFSFNNFNQLFSSYKRLKTPIDSLI